MAQRGRPRVVDNAVTVAAPVNKEVYDRLTDMAAFRSLSRSALVREILTEAVGAYYAAAKPEPVITHSGDTDTDPAEEDAILRELGLQGLMKDA